MKESAIITLAVFAVVLIALICLWASSKRQTKKDKAERPAPVPYILRGENLDRQMKSSLPRNPDENDWDYVKRIFPIVCLRCPNSAVSILFGKSITELDEGRKQQAGHFFMTLTREKKEHRIKRKIDQFLERFDRDPADFQPFKYPN